MQRKLKNRLGISTLIFRESTLDEALRKLGETALRTIDLSIIFPSFCPHYDLLNTTSADDVELKAHLEALGFRVSTINVVPGFFNADAPDRAMQVVKRALDVASAVGAHSITVPSGQKAEVSKWEEEVLVVKRYLGQVLPYAQKKNIEISIETPHVRTLTESIEQSRRFHDCLDMPEIKCTLDTSHVQRIGTVSLVDAVHIIGFDRINHLHLRDAVGQDIDITPGKGKADFKTFLSFMRDSGYQGDYILELEYEDIDEVQKYSEIEFARVYCNSLLDGRKLPARVILTTTPLGKLLARFKRNPKAEVKRHRTLVHILRALKHRLQPYMPEKVYDGRWTKKVRWNKSRIYKDRKNSIHLAEHSSRRIRLGIVGCGWAGTEMHAPGFDRLADVEIVGFHDIVTDKAHNCADLFGGRVYDNVDQMITNGRPSLISVCSSEWTHYEVVMKALNNGVDVFCEKLLATRYKDAQEMVRVAKRMGRVLGVNYNYRYMPGIRKVKEIIVQQALGDLSFLNINIHAFSYAHALDLLSFLGGKIISVSGYYRNDDNIRKFGVTDWKVYDKDILYVPSIAASVTVEFESGALGIVNSTYFYDINSFVLSLDAVFTAGAASLSGINMFNTIGDLTYNAPYGLRKVDPDFKRGVYAKGYEYTFYESIKHFMERYVVEEPPPINGEQGLYNMNLERAIAESQSKHMKVRMKDFQLQA